MSLPWGPPKRRQKGETGAGGFLDRGGDLCVDSGLVSTAEDLCRKNIRSAARPGP